MRGLSQQRVVSAQFIVGIARKTREDREIGSLRHRYAPGLIVRFRALARVDTSRVIPANMARMAAFPDRGLQGANVIAQHHLRVVASQNPGGQHGLDWGDAPARAHHLACMRIDRRDLDLETTPHPHQSH